MKTSSAKNKGRLLQKHVVQLLYKYFITLGDGDLESRSMGAGGEDVMLSKYARELIPFSFECKSLSKIAVYKYYEQAKENAGGREPVVVIKQNRHPPLVVIDLEKFVEIISR
jgi:hypothetical protein